MDSQAPGLQHYWKIIKNGKWFIIGGTVFLTVATALISFLLPPVYEASMILETGKLYPIPEEGIRKEVELIEEPMAMAELLRSSQFLDTTRKKLGLDLTLEEMEKRLEVEQIVALTRFQRAESTLILVSWEDTTPALCVKVLNSLAEQLIEEHRRIFKVAMKAFAGRLESRKKQIAAGEKIIANQARYQKVMKERLKMVEASIADYEKTVREINFDKADMKIGRAHV